MSFFKTKRNFFFIFVTNNFYVKIQSDENIKLKTRYEKLDETSSSSEEESAEDEDEELEETDDAVKKEENDDEDMDRSSRTPQQVKENGADSLVGGLSALSYDAIKREANNKHEQDYLKSQKNTMETSNVSMDLGIYFRREFESLLNY